MAVEIEGDEAGLCLLACDHEGGIPRDRIGGREFDAVFLAAAATHSKDAGVVDSLEANHAATTGAPGGCGAAQFGKNLTGYTRISNYIDRRIVVAKHVVGQVNPDTGNVFTSVVIDQFTAIPAVSLAGEVVIASTGNYFAVQGGKWIAISCCDQELIAPLI